MNKIFLIIAIVSVLPVYSACSVENDFVCTLPEVRQPYAPNFSAPSSLNSGINTAPSHPLNNSNLGNKVRDFAGGANEGYNSNCQFGVCLPDRNRPMFLQDGNQY